ncbi:hypothetical protein [Thalassococcus sp. S3]|uniref:hypothetical protein n=1 Tax=Thalassococcus sp. S3 TaxID=2017482 RepID=UPI0010244D87|nr:hypothetical protein [Thalassococcus sp. S3]QBF31857.1 hypothetical protein CFI11_11590 [Thalassococcus sp. S3]
MNEASALEGENDPVRRLEIIEEALRPPEPQLLDTCVLQNLDWVDRQIEEPKDTSWCDEEYAVLCGRFGQQLADDLIDLGYLYKQFEWRGGYPWLVCETNFKEIGRARGTHAARLKDIVTFLHGHQDDWVLDSYGGSTPRLLWRKGLKFVSPLMLKGLGISRPEQLFQSDGPLSFLHDEGDRQIAGTAIYANVPAVLTTDRSTFWKYRNNLSDFGLLVLRPSELLQGYDAYWGAVDEEMERRRSYEQL